MKKILTLIFYLCFTLLLGGCSDVKENKDMKVLRVGTTANFPPFEYVKPNGKELIGFDIELMRDLGHSIGYDRVEFVDVEFNKLLEGVEKKEYDVAIAGLAVTSEREQKVAFSKPYIVDGLTIVLPVGTKLPNIKASLNGKRVAAESGSLAASWLLKNNYADEVVLTSDTVAAIKAVEEDQADCMLASKLAVAYLLANRVSESVHFADDGLLVKDEIAIAVNKDNKVLVEKLNSVLEQYRKGDAYKKLCRKYFGSII